MVYDQTFAQIKLEVVNQELHKLFEIYKVQFYKEIPITLSITISDPSTLRDNICVRYYTFFIFL